MLKRWQNSKAILNCWVKPNCSGSPTAKHCSKGSRSTMGSPTEKHLNSVISNWMAIGKAKPMNWARPNCSGSPTAKRWPMVKHWRSGSPTG
jgi:hypothetical protein